MWMSARSPTSTAMTVNSSNFPASNLSVCVCDSCRDNMSRPGAYVAGVGQAPGADVRLGEPSPGFDVAGVGPVPVKMWQGSARTRRRCGRGGPSPGEDVAGVNPVPAQMWQG
jgi:hypothetical protein